MLGSKHFHEKNKDGLNSVTNKDGSRIWAPDTKYQMELVEALKRQRVDMEEGILAKFTALRTR